MLEGPNTLNVRVVAVSKESPFRLLIDRQQRMTSGFPEANKCIYLGGKGRKFAGQLANFRAQRRIVSGVLEQPHNKKSDIEHQHREQTRARRRLAVKRDFRIRD